MILYTLKQIDMKVRIKTLEEIKAIGERDHHGYWFDKLVFVPKANGAVCGDEVYVDTNTLQYKAICSFQHKGFKILDWMYDIINDGNCPSLSCTNERDKGLYKKYLKTRKTTYKF